MRSLILLGSTRLLVGSMMAFSLFLLWRGHNEPGGGFVGGLVASVALGLLGISGGPGAVRRMLRIDPRALTGLGIVFALAAGVWGLLSGGAFLEGLWITLAGIKLGTPLLFDIGVYLVVIGAVTTMILTLEEQDA
ncbi:MAG: MnhB domain-containing protein [Planctomycetota bacterium]|nr:MnhB domain-containing protein [Planctomycetota bacterium]